jgi:hypothetical protein
LQEVCSRHDPVLQSSCRTRIFTVLDRIEEAQRQWPREAWKVCIPPSTSVQQIGYAVIPFLRSNTMAANGGRDGLIASALAAAFPCR